MNDYYRELFTVSKNKLDKLFKKFPQFKDKFYSKVLKEDINSFLFYKDDYKQLEEELLDLQK